MKKVICVLILFLIGCSSDEPQTFTSPGTESLKRNFGKGFYTVETRSEVTEGSSQKYYFSRDLYYKNKKIDEASYVYVSPSGRYAVYESMIHGGVILFDTKGGTKYFVIKGAVPSVETWSKNEEIFIMRCYLQDGEKRLMKIDINNLKPLEE